MYDRKGSYYQVWRCALPAFIILLWLRRGEPALAIPPLTENRDGRRWWSENLWHLIRRTLSDGIGGVGTVLLAVLSLLMIPLVPALVELSKLSDLRVRMIAIGVVVLAVAYAMVLVVLYSAYLALRALPPERYAEVALSGRQPSDVLRLLAWEIRACCRAFLRDLAPFHKLFDADTLQQMRNGADEDKVNETLAKLRDNKDLIARNLAQFRRTMPVRDRALQRLMALKRRGAECFLVSQRRFCDHLVRYSPRLQLELLNKYAENLEFFLRVIDRPHVGHHARIRLVALLKENRRIVTVMRQRVEIQSELFDNADLHPYVYQMASKPSTLEATMAYARALAKVGAEAVRHDFGGNPSSPEYVRFSRRLYFLYRKQRVHPGFELHLSLSKICELVAKTQELHGSIPSTEAYAQVDVLKAIATGTLHDGGTDSARIAEKVARHLHAAKGLGYTAELYFERSRSTIAQQFAEVARERLVQASQAGSSLAIVTCSYSKTVREALKSGLTQALMAANEQVVRLESVGERASRIERPLIFLVNREGADDFATQRMLYELREDPEYRSSVVVGSSASVAGMLSECKHVLVVLGVESFNELDTFGESGCVMQTPEVSEQIRDVLMRLTSHQTTPHVLFVAGAYKTIAAPLLRQQRVLVTLRHATVFPHDHIDVIISDNGIWKKERRGGTAA